jgi:hypothetical protein
MEFPSLLTANFSFNGSTSLTAPPIDLTKPLSRTDLTFNINLDPLPEVKSRNLSDKATHSNNFNDKVTDLAVTKNQCFV